MAEDQTKKPEENKEERASARALQDELSKHEKEREEYLDGWKRAKADFVNYKKEEAQRFEQFARLSNEALVVELLSVLDSFNLGLTMLGDNEPARKGMSLIKNQLEDLLKRHGFEKIAVRPGDSFDTSFHEAIGEAESDKTSGAVAEEVEAGYKLGGKVIRPARVKIAK